MPHRNDNAAIDRITYAKVQHSGSRRNRTRKRKRRVDKHRLIEEPYICLMKSPATDYQKKASELMYRIPVWRPSPCFEIKISDLSDQVKKELDSIWRYKRQLDYILKEAVSRIFANVNDRYFLLSVKRLLQVRLVP